MNKLYFLFFLIFIVSCQDKEPNKSQVSRIDSLETEIASLKRANDTLSDHLMKRSYVTKEYPDYFDTIPEPEKFIINDLQQNPELIPEDGVLGGTMRFTNVNFINDELLVAEFEDGHIMGKAIYTYKIDRNGALSYSFVGNIEY